MGAEMNRWNELVARMRLGHVATQCGLKFSEPKYKLDGGNPRHIASYRTNGLRLTQHRNTWKRKRESSYLIRIEYVLDDSTLMVHVEPWVNYPSDVLVAKLMLLPPEVTKEAAR